jgi:hypothetical protein
MLGKHYITVLLIFFMCCASELNAQPHHLIFLIDTKYFTDSVHYFMHAHYG